MESRTDSVSFHVIHQCCLTVCGSPCGFVAGGGHYSQELCNRRRSLLPRTLESSKREKTFFSLCKKDLSDGTVVGLSIKEKAIRAA